MDQQMLGVDTPHECDFSREIAREEFRIHGGSARLQRVKRINAQVDQIRDDLIDGSAGMQDHLKSVPVSQVGQLTEVRKNEFAKRVRTHQQIELGAEIISKEKRVDQVSGPGKETRYACRNSHGEAARCRHGDFPARTRRP